MTIEKLFVRGAGFAFAVTALVLVNAGAAQAQPVRPNILFIFDTSTSMLANSGCPAGATGDDCDGSMICGGQGQASRLFRLKQAIRDTLTEAGTDEANFGLARFPQRVTPETNRGCYRGHYINSIASGAGAGCKTSSPTEPADGAWFTPAIASEVVTVPVTRVVPPAAGDYDPRGANIVSIYDWLDNVEVSNGTAITDPEIRAGGPGTPLAASLFYTRLYFQRYVKPTDPKATCRKDIAILVTDGDETCATAAEAITRARELYAAGVDLYVVVQTGEDGTTHNDMAREGSGGRRTASIKVDFTNPTATKAVLLNIIAEAVPPSEICNGVDDNCNNQIDEAPLPGVGNACLCPGLTEANIGKGMCKRGVTVCKGAAGIACEGCILPTAELCNGLDDNCNGEVDEGFDLGRRCDNGLRGACFRQGTTVCRPDGSGVFCDAPTATGTAEICNGVDDDCNGMIDEGMLPGSNEPCGPSMGACMSGRTKCEGGRFVCVGQTGQGMTEICNAMDDNCNGLVDENISGVGGTCACPPFTLQQLMTGECRPGKLVCKGRMPLDCEGCIGPRGEICDGKDNDCDGMIDTPNPCTEGRQCMGGKCEIPCKQDEFPCPLGFKCNYMRMPPVCESTKCTGVVCPTDTTCDEGSGKCINLCENVTCTAPQVCRAGRCQDCRTLGCPTGEVCTEGVCKTNPCANKVCGANQFCQNGECLDLCQPSCTGGQRCVRGTCVADPCANAPVCSNLQVCDPATGMCVTDLCSTTGRGCLGGQVCVPTTGMCKDNPCSTTTCPGACLKCQMSPDGVAACVPVADCGNTNRVQIGTRGGGCSCGVPGGTRTENGGFALVGLGLLAVALRRRRPRR
jgi:MYXO-CTERM domain-containing protein